MRWIFILALAILLSCLLVYTALGLSRLIRLLLRNDIFATVIAVLILLLLVVALPQVNPFLKPGEQNPRRQMFTESSSAPQPENEFASAAKGPDRGNSVFATSEAKTAPGTLQSSGSVPHGSAATTSALGKSQEEIPSSFTVGSETGPATSGGLTPGEKPAGEVGAMESLSGVPKGDFDKAGPSSQLMQGGQGGSPTPEEPTTPPVNAGEIQPSGQAGPEKEFSLGASHSDEVPPARWQLEPKDWINRAPFYLEDKKTLAWPIALGPYLEPTDPLSVGQLRRLLPEPWFYWLVEEAPQRASPDLVRLLFGSAQSRDRHRPWDRKIRWVPPELWKDLTQQISNALARICREELGSQQVPPFSPVWVAEHLVRDVYWEAYWAEGTARPVLLDSPEGSANSLAVGRGLIPFRVHVLLVFDGLARRALERQIHQATIHRRVKQLSGIFLGLTAAIALWYGSLRMESKHRGHRPIVLRIGLVLGWVIIFLVVYRLFLA